MAISRVIAQNVQAIRAALGITQQELADKAKLSRASVTALEGGRFGSCNLTTVEQLARALRVEVWQLCKPPSPGSEHHAVTGRE